MKFRADLQKVNISDPDAQPFITNTQPVFYHISFQIKHVNEAFVHPYFNAQQGSEVALLKLDSTEIE